MAKRDLPSPDVLRQLLRYEPETGKLFWRERPSGLMPTDDPRGAAWKANQWNSRYAGTEAFTTLNTGGYLKGTIFGRYMVAHRVIWAMATGYWPSLEIDHMDGIRTNNRLANLREVTPTDNQKNQRKYRNNSSGHTGVHWHKRDRKWQAYIQVDGRVKFLGMFDDITDAKAARDEARLSFGYTERHGT